MTHTEKLIGEFIIKAKIKKLLHELCYWALIIIGVGWIAYMIISMHKENWSYVGNTYNVNGETLDIVGMSGGEYTMSNGVYYSRTYIKQLTPINK